MADSADTFLGVVVTLAVITAIVSGAHGGTVPSTTTTTTTGGTSRTTTSRVPPASTQSTSTNIPSGTVFTCGGQLISTDTVDAGGGALTLEVFYSSVNGGRNCAVATKTGTVAQRRGHLVTTLQFHIYDGRRWPRYAIQRTNGDRARAYIDNTDNKCVRAWARFLPETGPAATVTSGKVGCS